MTRLSLLLLTAAAAAPASAQVTVATYARAEQRLSRRADSLVLRDKITPRWIAGSDRFWYRVRTPAGAEFIYVDPDRGVRRPAFDHVRLAAELGRVADTTLAPSALPFESLEWLEEGKRVAVVVGVRGKSWRCDLGKYRCDSVAAAKPANPSEAVSPDGRWAVTLERHNLWIRNTATGERRALTTDGVARHEYGGTVEGNTAWVSAQRLGWPQAPVVLWTADSKRLLVQRIDQRRVPETFLLQSVTASGQRPKSWAFAVPMPGDSVAVAAWVILDAADGRRTDVAAPAVAVPYQASIAFQQAWWADSAGTRAYYLDPIRGGKVFRFREIDGRTGTTRTVAEEAGPTMVEPSLAIGQRPNIRVTSDQREVIWFSQRSGFAHLYLLDQASGAVKSPITSGDWVVREIIRVDERARRIWFTAGGREPGRDPYYRHLYAINYDGSGLTLLTPEDADHDVTLGAGGQWVVDRYSRADLAPVTVARSLDGKRVVPLESADVSRLLATGWRWPERFVVKAADGVTDLYGVLFTPAGFDPAQRYPVIEEVYPGPQVIKVAKGFEAGGDHRALVELGFVGIQVDGRGTPLRSKAFHDYSYGRLENGGGLEDHVAAFRQLAPSRPWADFGRLGVYGHSGGGFASARAMMLYPDVYKVAVSSAGNHDQRGYISIWGETYHGMPAGDNYAAQANPSLAANLKGKLMLAYGDMDDNVAPALTIQLIEALTKAEKDYDLLVVPNGNHAMMASPYFRRRRWDYFVEHLLGQTPPTGYRITTPPEYPIGN